MGFELVVIEGGRTPRTSKSSDKRALSYVTSDSDLWKEIYYRWDAIGDATFAADERREYESNPTPIVIDYIKEHYGDAGKHISYCQSQDRITIVE